MNEVFQYSLISEKILNTVDLPAGTFYPDLTQISARLCKRLNLQDFEIEVEQIKWQLDEEIDFLESEDFTHLSISFLPLESAIHWIMNLSEVSKLTTWVMTKDETAQTFSSEILQEGFYHYLMLETIDAVDYDNILKGFSLKILPEPTAFQSPSLCADIRITYRGRSAYAKLVIPKELAQSWKDRFFKEDNFLVSKTADIADFFLSIKVGSVDLNHTTLDTIAVGDFVVLDHSYYDPKTHQGTVLLTFNQEPIYQVKITQNMLKILDFVELKEDHMEDTEQTIPVEEVPLSIQIEMGKIKMSLAKLMSLKPGEALDTTINPDEKVSLVLNNKTIAKGELIKVGETIGVRILEIG